ncbi:probable palmitoyltransferase ZDHHC24, partial [Pelobates cultripes]
KRSVIEVWRRCLTMSMKDLDPSVVLPLCITCLLVSSVTLEIFYVMHRDAGSSYWPLLMLSFYLLFNVVGNMWKFVRSNPTIKGVFLEHDVMIHGNRYCYTCQTHVPPRCNHCYNCNVCVLRRDHHCALLGQCVGHSNYRYFFCTLFHGWLALLLATVLNAEIFMELLNEGISFHSFFLLLMPWMMLVTVGATYGVVVLNFVRVSCIGGQDSLPFRHIVAVWRDESVFWGYCDLEGWQDKRMFEHCWQLNLRRRPEEIWVHQIVFPPVKPQRKGAGKPSKTAYSSGKL